MPGLCKAYIRPSLFLVQSCLSIGGGNTADKTVASKQFDPEIFLKVSDPLAYCGLGYAKDTGGLLEAPFRHYSQEDSYSEILYHLDEISHFKKS